MSESTECFVDGIEVHLVELEMFVNDITETIKEIREEINVFNETTKRKELLEGLRKEKKDG